LWQPTLLHEVVLMFPAHDPIVQIAQVAFVERVFFNHDTTRIILLLLICNDHWQVGSHMDGHLFGVVQ
jgi:hypothetical protein